MIAPTQSLKTELSIAGPELHIAWVRLEHLSPIVIPRARTMIEKAELQAQPGTEPPERNRIWNYFSFWWCLH